MTRATRWALGIAVVGALVATAPFLSSNNLLPRRVFLHLAALICLAISASRGEKVAVLWVLLSVELALSWSLSGYRTASLPGFADALALIGVIAGLQGARIGRTGLVKTLVAVSAAAALWGLAEQWLPLEWGAASRPAALFASRVTAGAMMAAAVPLTCVALYRRPWTLSVALALEGAFLISTRTRVAWVAAVTMLVAVAVVVPRLRSRLAWASAGAVVLALAVTPGPRLQWHSARPYADSIEDVAQLRVGDRLEVWRETVRLLLQKPLGNGPGSFESSFAARAGALPAALDGMEIEAPHNEPLRFLYEAGLPGVGLLIAAMWPRRRQASVRTRLLQLTLLVLAICSMTGKTAEDPPTAIVGAIVLGLLLRARGPHTQRAPAAPTALLVAVLLLVVALDGRAVWASRAFAQAQFSAQRGDARAALASVSPTLAYNPTLRTWLWTIDLVKESGDRKRCRELSEQALGIFPDHPMLKARILACE